MVAGTTHAPKRVHRWLKDFSVFNRVFQSGFLKPFQAQLATVAHATRLPVFSRIVTTMGHGKIHSQFQTFLNDLHLAQLDQWGVDFYPVFSFHSGFGGEVGESFKRGDELGSAIGVTAIINGIDPDKNIAGFFHFRVSQAE